MFWFDLVVVGLWFLFWMCCVGYCMLFVDLDWFVGFVCFGFVFCFVGFWISLGIV